LEHARVPPTAWYTESDFFHKVELPNTFRGNTTWLYVGRTEQLAAPGAYVAQTVAGTEPVVVINAATDVGEAPRLVGYYNVCRHHGAQLVDDGAGTCPADRRLTCPYHGWQYLVNDGRLAKAVGMKGSQCFTAATHALLPVAVDTLGPWVFVNVSGASPTGTLLGDQPDLAAMADALEATRYRSLVHYRSKTYRVACNWKVYVDNFLDGGLHIATAHPGLANELDMGTYTREGGHRNFFLQTCRNKDVEGSARTAAETTAAGAGTGAARYYFHYPSLCVNRYGSWMDINAVTPDGPHACTVQFEWWVDPALLAAPGGPAAAARCVDESEKIQEEDAWLCARVQAGVASAAYGRRVGVYAPTYEAGEHFFHRRVSEDLDNAMAAAAAAAATGR